MNPSSATQLRLLMMVKWQSFKAEDPTNQVSWLIAKNTGYLMRSVSDDIILAWVGVSSQSKVITVQNRNGNNIPKSFPRRAVLFNAIRNSAVDKSMGDLCITEKK